MGVQLTSRIYPLRLPLEPNERKGWRVHPVFGDEAAGGIACHASVLLPGRSPHPPQDHDEEELLLILSGEVELLLPGRVRSHLRAGELVYFPAGFAHTPQTMGTEPATYVVFKWGGQAAEAAGQALPFGRFDTAGSPGLLFEAPTGRLVKLQAHVTVLEPGDGYPPHTDAYDVAIVVLTGEVETLGARAKPHDVIRYVAGESHGMQNVGDVAATYVVFEFHGQVPTGRHDAARRHWRLGRLLGRRGD